MLYAVYYIALCMQNAALIWLTSTAAGFRIQEKKHLTVPALLLSAVPQFVMFFPSKGIPPAAGAVLLIFLLVLKTGCYKVILRQRFRRMVYLAVLSVAMNTYYTNVLRLFTDERFALNIAGALTEMSIELAVTLYLRRKNHAAVVTESLKRFPPALYITVLVFLFLLSYLQNAVMVPGSGNAARMLVLPTILVMFYIIIRIVQISAKAREHERIAEVLAEQLEHQVEYYQKIHDIYAEFRSFRHDFRNHLICLRSLLAENEVQRALEYMDEMEQMSHRSKHKTFETGNIIVDSLLNDKAEHAAAHHTKIVFSGFVPTIGITNADLCTIFANAADNAIEACAKDSSEAEKEISIHSDFRQGYFILRITNPVYEKVRIRHGNQVETSKENKEMHGFGVANIVRTAKKYGGEVTLTADENTFTLEAGLWLQPEE